MTWECKEGRSVERMSDLTFRMMTLLFKVVDSLYPYIDKRVRRFGIQDGMTVVDYGCGPGRYTTRFARLVGERGKVYAVDIHELAIEAVEKKMAKQGLVNVEPVLARGYDSGVPDDVADVVCAIDMFFAVREPTVFLGELKRIARPEGVLVIDHEHQTREKLKRKILDSGHWVIEEESRDHLKCRPA
jgi:ubiquinone/menaquinone biosynthesis C-methylase UbiE